jgi:hypothetical protein
VLYPIQQIYFSLSSNQPTLSSSLRETINLVCGVIKYDLERENWLPLCSSGQKPTADRVTVGTILPILLAVTT